MLLGDKIFSAIDDDDEYVLGVFLDFRKAFDCLDHSILLWKLEVYGVRGTTLYWFQSYLTDRQQFVYFDDVQSEKKTKVCGVPQGSILGPLSFLSYINDIVNVSNVLYPLLYADNTNIFISGKMLINL